MSPSQPPVVTESVVVIAAGQTVEAIDRSAIPAVTSKDTAATTITQSGPRALPPLDTGGVGGSGSSTSTFSLEPGLTYRAEDFTLAFEVATEADHWNLGRQSPNDVLFEWTGPDGSEAGTLYVALYDAANRSEDEVWAALEGSLTESLAGQGDSLVWIDQSTGTVAGQPAAWREMRTPVEVIRPGGWPCAVSIPSGCIWKDATARFYVVALGEFTVVVTVYENRCDCGAGPGYSRFLDDANELHDWVGVFEVFLAGLSFDAAR